jgi:hypothetical protein
MDVAGDRGRIGDHMARDVTDLLEVVLAASAFPSSSSSPVYSFAASWTLSLA